MTENVAMNLGTNEVSTIMLTNMVANGGFESGTAGWDGYQTTNKGQETLAVTTIAPYAPRHSEVGVYSARMYAKTQGLLFMNLTTPITVVPGRKYYIRAQANLLYDAGSLTSVCTIVNDISAPPERGDTMPIPMSEGLQTTDITGWTLIDTIWTADTNALHLRVVWQVVGNYGNNELFGEVDNIVVVDLTEAFTAGLEPPLIAIRGGVNYSPPNGHWDGETEITMPVPPNILTYALDLALKSRPYSAQIEIEEGTGTREFAFTLDGLPPGHGLMINSDGVIYGTPGLEEGSYNFMVLLTDAIGYSVSRAYTLDVGEPPVILDEFLINPTIGEWYEFIPNVSGSQPIDVFISVSGILEPNLTNSGGRIYGTPASAGYTCQITVTAYNKFDTSGVSKIFPLAVYAAAHINNTSPLATGILGEEYSVEFSVSGVKPILIEYLSDELPPGLVFENGTLYGTPTEVGVYNFSIRASNSEGSDTRTFTMSVAELPVITTQIFGYARLEVPYSGQLTATGTEPITFAITGGQLPPGLTLNRDTGIISGAALVSGSYPFTVVATNIAGDSAPKNFVINSGLALAIVTTSPLAVGTVNMPYPQLQFHAEGLDSRQVPLQEWNWAAQSSSALPPGLSFDATTGILFGTPTAAGVFTFHVTVINGIFNATAPFIIEIGTPPTITTPPQLAGGVDRPFTTVLHASGPQPITFTMSVPPPSPAYLELDPNGSLYWLVPETGTYNFTVFASNGFGNSMPVNFALTITTPSIITVDLPRGIVGEQYSAKLEGSGAEPYTWALIGALPPGLSFDTQTATISGIPQEPGTANFEISLTNVGGTAQESFTINVYDRPKIITTALNSGNAGLYYSQIIFASSSTDITFSLSGSLPQGLTLSGAVISGVPITEETATFTVIAENILGPAYADRREFTITILPSGAPVITTNAVLDGTRGKFFEQLLGADGEEPIDWELQGQLPTGLNFDDGELSGIPRIYGTPEAAGEFSFLLIAANDYGIDTRTFTLTVGDPPAITTQTLPDGKTCTDYYETLTATGDPPIIWELATPSGSETGLPPGLTLNPQSGEIAGKPTKAGTFTFTVRVANSSGSDSAALAIKIGQSGGTFVRGKEIERLFVWGKEVERGYVGGRLVFSS